jgi:pimeloyl-ACP methyl ester carboxylesterase
VRATDSFAEVRGARLRFRDEGAGSPVVLLHGWALDLDVWAPQAAALAPRYRVIRFDRRGFGLSGGAPSLDDDLLDLQALLDRLGVDRAALVGSSQAARVVLRAALAAPDRVACLVLDGAPDEVTRGARALTADDIPLAAYRELARGSDMDSVRRDWSRHPFTRLVGGDAGARARLGEIIARYPGRDLLAPDAGPPPRLAAQLRSIAAPALVLNGEGDTSSRLSTGALLASAVPRARRVMVPAAGHLPNLDNPTFYNAALFRFFRESLDELDAPR